MRLVELLADLYPGDVPAAQREVLVTGISTDSRRVEPGHLFVAVPGPVTHGRQFIPAAVERGARVIVLARSEGAERAPGEILLLPVDDIQDFLPRLLARFYGDPGQRLRIFGVTGTNGKTTITYLVESIFAQAGQLCGVVGTVSHRIGAEQRPAQNTTPGLVENYRFLAQLADRGGSCCVMEVSSHALAQGRVDGLVFQGAIFTNLTGDHLDYHLDMEDYFLAKRRLFDGLGPAAVAVINREDAYGRRLAEDCPAPVVTYGRDEQADLFASQVTMTLDGTRFVIQTPSGPLAVTTPLVGWYNIDNILAAVGLCLAENLPLEQIQSGIRALACVPGRLERVDCGQPFHVFLDYAHTDDALRNVLTGLRPLTPGRLIVVFGCGGDRDQGKRARMGAVADELADWSFVTTDNPRRESPQQIIDQIVAGFRGQSYAVIPDRTAAIQAALAQARAGDLVLLAGKGHEGYQIFADRTVPFDERAIVEHFLRERAHG